MSALNLSRLYRAVLELSAYSRAPARHVFIQAPSHNAAISKICCAVASLEHRLPADIEHRVYNCLSVQDLMDDGVSEDRELRMFETGWSYGKPTYVREPLFLVDEPSVLIRLWVRCPQEVAP